MTHPRPRLLFTLVFLLAAACSSPTTPITPVGAYAALPAAGAEFPILIMAEGGDTLYLLQGGLSLTPDGRGARFYETELRQPGRPPVRTFHEEWFTYSTSGLRVDFDYICPPNALCLRTVEWGWLLPNGGLVVNHYGSFPTLRYRRTFSTHASG